MKLRPHHIIDIVTAYGHGEEFKPHPYGHAVHTVAQSILSDVALEVELIIGADEICQPCKHLQSEGRCDDVLHQLDPPTSKQEYNDDLDRRLLAYLDITPGAVSTVREYLEIVDKSVPGIEKICTHPAEDQQSRLDGLEQGLIRLGVRRGDRQEEDDDH